MKAFWVYVRTKDELVTQDQIEKFRREIEKIDGIEEAIVSSPTAEN
jgi:hypothetical protein